MSAMAFDVSLDVNLVRQGPALKDDMDGSDAISLEVVEEEVLGWIHPLRVETRGEI